MTRSQLLIVVVASVVGAWSGFVISPKLTQYITPSQRSTNREEHGQPPSAGTSATGGRGGAGVPDCSRELVAASEELNRSLPTMVDQETRLDTIIPGPGNRLTYVYTLVNRDKEDVNVPGLRSYLKPRTIANYKTQDTMRDLREHDVELRYQYRDKRGEPLLDLSITPKDF